MTDRLPYQVVTNKYGWHMVVGEPEPRNAGPWRYNWEAQDYADELNAAAHGTAGS